MADSKKQKPSKAKSSTSSTGAKKVDSNVAKVPTKPTATPKTTAKTDSAAKTKTATATKVEPGKTEKTVANTTPANKTTAAKKAEPTVAKAAQKPTQKEKRSGGGMAFLALLCSLGALGLSGYNFYEQKLSPKTAQTQEALLSGVNDIKGNVTEFSGVVTSLQQDVKDFKESQSQYITKDTLDSAVKESVDNAVANLPELPKIGPAELNEGDSSSSSENRGNMLEGSSPTQGASTVDGTSTSESASSTAGSVSTGVTNTEDSSTSIENTQESSSDGASNAAEEEKIAWSWGRAKQDFKEMVMGFISIKKTDQGNN